MTPSELEAELAGLDRARKAELLKRLAEELVGEWPGIESDPAVAGGAPCIVRTRIPLWVLESYRRQGWTEARILANNIVQTIASAGESLAAGIIFTMPALVIAGVWSDFDFWVTTLVSITGGLLGVLFMIPLRKPMIVEDKELTYPEGVACAKVLKAGEEGGAGMRLIFGALGLAAVIKLCTDAFSIFSAELKLRFALGPSYFLTGIKAAPALIGVGFIVGANIATLVFIGGAISWLAAGPILTAIDYEGVVASVTADSVVDTGALEGAVKPHLRMMGVGAMIVGGLWSIFMIRNGIVRGLQETMGGYRASMRSEVRPERTDTDMEPRWIFLLIAATGIVILGLYFHVTGAFGVSVLATVLMVICSFFFVAVAAYIVGLVGSSNSPVSGMTICSVLLTSAFIFLFGYQGDVAILATMGVAGVVCCATCTSGDVCQDLKTGALVGATPKRQQWVEILGVISASFVMWWALDKLHRGYGIGTDAHLSETVRASTDPLEAPQAQLFANLMSGFFGDSTLPWNLIAIGAGIGLAIILIDQRLLKPRRSAFRMHVMPVAVGMYLPFGLTSAIFVGGMLAWLAGRGARSEDARNRGIDRGVILASGLIAGEAISGVAIAIPAAAEMQLPKLITSETTLTALGVVVITLLCVLIVRISRPREA